MKRKVYGVEGLMEWQALIPVGRSVVAVTFDGGSFTSYGMSPARFETTDKALQTIIEHSRYFKERKITLLQETDIPEKENPEMESVRNSGIDELKVVAVGSLEEAKDYLADNHGIERVKLKNRNVINAMGVKAGIRFEYPEK